MRTWTVDGRTVTNRAGAAEYLGLSRATIDMYASPTGQRRYGFPAPLPERCDGQQVFAVADLEAFAAVRRPARAPAPEVDAAAAAEELVDSRGFARLIGVRSSTFHRYLTDSWVAWGQGGDGYLPRPDNWPGRSASLIDQVARRLPEVATCWAAATSAVINEAAVAVRLGCSVDRVRRFRSGKDRPDHFPAPLSERVDGQVVYDGAVVDDAANRGAREPRRGRPPTPALIYRELGDTARALVNQPGIGALLDIPPATVARYATAGTYDFPAAADRPAEHGPWYDLADVLLFAGQWALAHPMWLRSTVDAWSHGDRKRTGGRKSGRRPVVADLRAVLAEVVDEQFTVGEIAQRLSDRLDTDVSAQVVRRLKRALADELDSRTETTAGSERPDGNEHQAAHGGASAPRSSGATVVT